MKDRLFLLKPGFEIDGDGPLYCGDSVAVEGLLSFYPELRSLIDVDYVAFPRPRSPIVDLVGVDHQSVPLLVLAEEREVQDESIVPQTVSKRRFLNDEAQIRKYLSSQYGIARAG